jgi:hypothetical protein
MRFTREQAYELYDLASVQIMLINIRVFIQFVMPLEKTGLSIDRAKCAKVWMRLSMAMNDAEIIIEKYHLREMFVRQDS